MAPESPGISKVEAERLASLRQYDVIDSPPEQGYEDITELAAFICGTPISLISFIEQDRQWFKSKHGLDLTETPRAVSFCAHSIKTAQTFIVPDTLADEEFRDNPLVVADPSIRFYAGAPIIAPSGHVLGSVCVIDSIPRTLTAEQIKALEALARQVVVLLDQRRAIETLESAVIASRAADLQIQDSQNRLQTFVDTFPALAWIADADGYITWYNRRWYQYTGTTPSQMEGWGWQSTHDPVALPSVMERWTASIRTGQPFEMIFPLLGADKTFRPFLTRVEPYRDQTGQITNWFGTNIEVDALHNARVELEKNTAVLNQVLTATSDAVVSVNRKWIITYFNPRAEEIYGYAKTLVGRNLWESFPEIAYQDSPFTEHYNRAMDDGIAGHFEAEFGDPLKYTLGVEVYPSKDGIVVFSRDITLLKHAAAAVLQNEKLAAVGRLASSIAHEINNPLEAVTNLLYLARQAESIEQARPYLANADLELRRASAITSKTLRFHRQATDPTHVTFAQLMDGIFVGQHSRLANSHVHVEQRDRAPLPVLCLEGEIRQVLINFISNAIDALHGRGGTLFLRGRDGTNWRTGLPGFIITVADNGTGMSETTRTRVFEAFYTTKGIGGTGLGLWISQEIVTRHHGTLTLKTSQRPTASGTVLTLFLPRHGVQPVSASHDATLQANPRQPFKPIPTSHPAIP